MLGSQYRPDPREDCDQIQSRNRWGISGISPAKKNGCRSTFISGPKCKLLQLNWKLDDAWGKWMYTYFNISEHMIRGKSRQYVYICILLLNNLQSLWLTAKGLCKGDPILRRDHPGIQIQQNKQYSYCGAVQNIHLFRCLVGSANLGYQHIGGQLSEGKEHVTYMCSFKNTIALKSLSNKMASNRNYAQ